MVIIVLMIIWGGGWDSYSQGPQSRIREPILAGTWYPGDPKVLAHQIKTYLSLATPPKVEGQVIGLIVPHAGYCYSGQVAAYAYKAIRGQKFKRVVMMGPSHRVSFRGISVNLVAGYKTPLGMVPVDLDFARKLTAFDPKIGWVRRAHEVEHSLEIQLPFLQTVLSDFKIVSVLMGSQDIQNCLLLARALTQLLGSEARSQGSRHVPTLVLASTDLSHYHPFERAVFLDTIFISYVKQVDPEGLYRALSRGRCEACGGGPAISLLHWARSLDATPMILKYANSGHVTGDKDRVVGYLASLFFRSCHKGPHQK